MDKFHFLKFVTRFSLLQGLKEENMRKLLLPLFILIALSFVPVLAQTTEVPTLHVRVAHFSPDAPAVDVYLNGAKSAIQGLTYPKVSEWVEIPARSYQIAAVPTGTRSAAIGPLTLDLPADAWLTIAAVGSATNSTLKATVITEDYTPISDGQARVTLFHAIEGAPPVDVFADDAQVVNLLAFPGKLGSNDGATTFDVDSGLYSLKVVPSGEAFRTLLEVPSTILVTKNNYFIAAVGTADAPQLVIVPTRS